MAPKTIYHRMKKLKQRVAANLRRDIGPTWMIMLLTTTGQKSGLSLRFNRPDLLKLSREKAIVILHPDKE